MIYTLIPVVLLLAMCNAEDYYYRPQNGTRATLSGIAAYRSALTLDWLAAEDLRQRELAAAFETEPAPPSRSLSTDCIAYARPASGKVARLMLELLKNLEGDEGTTVTDLIQALVRTKLLVETSMLDAEPDLESLVKTPGVMMGEPHTTFPRILAMTWMIVTDPVTTKKFGWCPINRVNKYLAISKPMMIAKQMKALEPVIARARFIMEEFIQHVTPLNMYQKKTPEVATEVRPNRADSEVAAMGERPESQVTPPHLTRPSSYLPPPLLTYHERFIPPKRPTRTPATIRAVHVALAQSGTTPLLEAEPLPSLIGSDSGARQANSRSLRWRIPHSFLTANVVVLYVINIS